MNTLTRINRGRNSMDSMISRFFGDDDGLIRDFFSPRNFWDYRTITSNITEDKQYPSVDIVKRKGELEIIASLPEFEKDEISITIENGVLTIAGDKSEEKEENGIEYIQREISKTSFKRSFSLKNINPDEVKASYEKGQLKILLPGAKVKSDSIKKIDIA